MATNKANSDIGIIGLGVMGQNLLLNIADQGFSVVGYDKDLNKVNTLGSIAQKPSIHHTNDIKMFIKLLRQPRAILLLVPAGSIVDAVIEDLLPYMEPDDLIIDAGNSYFKDTDLRSKYLAAKGLQFVGMGVSGGEEGARHGPSLMPGGPKKAYERIQEILEAIAAKVQGDPCVRYLGPGSVGHFVKMVHNGIEYGIMQLIAESYDLMKKGLRLSNTQLGEVYKEWNQSELNSYLMEITSHIFNKVDLEAHEKTNLDANINTDALTNKEKTEKSIKLIDNISDVARQLGTGMWTVKSAMELQVPTPTIDLAVSMRDLSSLTEQRSKITTIYARSISSISDKSDLSELAGLNNPKQFILELGHALYTSIIIVYCQGMALLKEASNQYHYELNLEDVAKIWRGGCIIRAALLEDIANAFHNQKNLPNLLLDPNLAQKIMQYENNLRNIISKSIQLGIPTPGMMASIGYLDAFCNKSLPTNLIQAQRDYFGSHCYERIDRPGTFHTEWEQ